ncbi:helix-turn-helix domain-containing protein [Companilactobacillus halodurans]|uniref:Helix-turn-helix domain-containing protein n=1 Tax=Companilactobacillus halodurans TaxID=2584183 RepID=A0A5P0ZW66_9LACO|nr:helix-turn-helix domain-containing protein [Companilactobacillus halodurans]MQS74845.1 helix-turn-helix domain-containing protein [Companilactobacillus halodurans]MQS97240.1 helix-turn-helix domain-containing protein [Companilactobacillus halodurans]
MNYNESQQKEIANYAMEHDNNYKATGEKYGISYQQVAAWVRKYKNNESKKATKPAAKATTLDVLSRKDPVLEAQLKEVKKRLGLI